LRGLPRPGEQLLRQWGSVVRRVRLRADYDQRPVEPFTPDRFGCPQTGKRPAYNRDRLGQLSPRW
jgi:hypothetical protein